MESLKSEIKQLIDKLAERYKNLPEGPLHPLDADLMLSLLRQIYEKTEILRNLPPVEVVVKAEPAQFSQPKQTQSHEPVATPVEIPIISPLIVPPVVSPSPMPAHPEIVPAQQPLSTNTVTFEASLPIKNEFSSDNEFARDPGISPNEPNPGSLDLFGPVSLADKLKSDTPSLNDKITAGKNDRSLADRMQLKPISDLRAAIGLNEKFQFINELFEGSSERYTEAMHLLNSCAGSKQAEEVFADLKFRYKWDDNNPVFKKLHEFLVRRYL